VSALPATGATPEQRVRAAEALLESAENDARMYATDAGRHLDRGDYSAAATACHRAHQCIRVAEALREVLR
jgi:hypothetical protein